MENYKIQNFETSLSFSSFALRQSCGFNVFTVIDKVSSVAVFFYGIEIHRIRIAHAHLMLFKFC